MRSGVAAFLVWLTLGTAAACGGTHPKSSGTSENDGGAGASGGTGASGGAGGSGGAGTSGGAGASGGAGTSGGAGASGGAGTSGGGGAPAVGPLDLCAGLVADKQPRPMSTLAKPALGAVVTDAELGTHIRRITQVAVSGANPAVRPMYSTISAWNADESRLILYDVGGGGHQLYDGKTYARLHALDIHPADLEQVYWHTSDPDILFYVDGTTFDFCAAGASGGDDPMFTSFDSARIGLKCGDQVFIYDIPSKTVLARKTFTENPAQVAPSGTLAYLSDSGRVTDAQLNVLRTLDLKEPFGHASMGRLPTGEDTWNGVVYDDGPMGNSDIGS